MKLGLDIAHAELPQPGKGEDAHLVRPISGPDSAHLLAVADGLTLNAGKAAAVWVKNWLKEVEEIESPRRIYQALKKALAKEQGAHDESETTLTCGILREVSFEDETFLRFEYFAIGDSPIWKVVESKKGSRYPFQRVIMHGPPDPAETAKVYATVRLHCGDISGMVTFGSVDIGPGEVLVVCTDGIPEEEVFIRDVRTLRDASGAPTSLCPWLFQRSSYRNEELEMVLADYNRRGVLYDDATIIVARLHRAETSDDTAQSLAPAEMQSSAIGIQSALSADRSRESAGGGLSPDAVQPGGVTEPKERMSAEEGAVADQSMQVATACEGETERVDNPSEDTVCAHHEVAAAAPEKMASPAVPSPTPMQTSRRRPRLGRLRPRKWHLNHTARQRRTTADI